jgi:hypothetical protein
MGNKVAQVATTANNNLKFVMIESEESIQTTAAVFDDAAIFF